jgi:hypothetical protein
VDGPAVTIRPPAPQPDITVTPERGTDKGHPWAKPDARPGGADAARPGETGPARRVEAGAARPGETKVDILHTGPPPSVMTQLREAGAAATQGVRDWSGRPAGRLVLPGLLIAGLLAIAAFAGFAGAFVVPRSVPPAPAAEEAPSSGGPDTDVNLSPGVPRPTTSVPSLLPGLGGRPADVLAAWAVPLASKLGIPAVALQAYGYAELTVANSKPACKLSWTTLAGIGKIESDHGRASGARLNPDGKSLPSIVGAPLDGQGGRKAIQDSDGGQLDGDRSWDRAVGPMQFIPSTWRQYSVDADNDGTTDINDIDDSSLAAANYLCASGRDLSTVAGWYAAVGAYNAVDVYITDVYNAANDYGRRSRI